MIHNYGKLKKWTFHGPIFIKYKTARYQMAQNNNNNSNKPNIFHKDQEIAESSLPKYNIPCHHPILDSVIFLDTIDNIPEEPIPNNLL